MPLDKSGRHHPNIQQAMAADRSPAKSSSPPASKSAPEAAGESESTASTTLHDHGDGTFHTESHDGESVDHPHIGHALAHMAGKHGGGAKHMNVHENGMGGHTSHHVGEDGQAQGPHDHDNIESLKDHLGKFFDEEENEWKGEDYGQQPEKKGAY